MSKKYNKYDVVFRDGKLTQLMIIKRGDRNYIADKFSYPLHSLLSAFLEDYGIWLGGAVTIPGWQVRAVTIKSSFNIANEPILRELYDFSVGTVNIQLSTNLTDNCAFAFNYDVADYTCTFEKYVHGETVECYEFDNLRQMLKYLKKREADEVSNE